MRIKGGEGGDDLRGGRLADDIEGGGGNDTLTGDGYFAGSPASHDDLDGGAGNDWLRGGEGRTSCTAAPASTRPATTTASAWRRSRSP